MTISTKVEGNKPLGSSFRDPSGFLFERDGVLLRQVNQVYKAHYDHLVESGLYKALVRSKMLIPHSEYEDEWTASDTAYKVLKPEVIRFISYPYEWCFSQLKDAALATLEIQKTAIKFGMCLKDASAYNIQFTAGRPVLIDTLSFEIYREGHPWTAYRQFCQHFLAPLALMSHTDIRLSQMLRVHLDGVPLDLVSSLLPLHTHLRFGLFSHLHLHARSQTYFSGKRVSLKGRTVSNIALLGIIDSLESSIRGLKWCPKGTEWSEYYSAAKCPYSVEAMRQKKKTVSEYLERINPNSVWDLGANDGVFSRLASDRGMPTIAFDVDPAAVERNYLDCVSRGETNLLPLLIDLTNPSSDIGWGNEERMSLLKRAPVDMVMALALLHHLAITNNVPLLRIAELLRRISDALIIEFVPKSDPQVAILLKSRKDVFVDYSREAFEYEFGKFFVTLAVSETGASGRKLYLMQARYD